MNMLPPSTERLAFCGRIGRAEIEHSVYFISYFWSHMPPVTWFVFSCSAGVNQWSITEQIVALGSLVTGQRVVKVSHHVQFGGRVGQHLWNQQQSACAWGTAGSPWRRCSAPSAQCRRMRGASSAKGRSRLDCLRQAHKASAGSETAALHICGLQ